MSKESSLHHYQCGAAVLGHITEKINQEPVPETVVNSWRTILSAIRLADIRIDSIKNSSDRIQEADRAIQSLDGNGQYETLDEDFNHYFGELKNLLNELPPNRKRQFLTFLKRVIRVGEKVKKADNPEDYSRYTKLEGQVTARLFLCILPPQLIKDKEAYYRVITRLGRVGNAFDNLCDFESDRGNGEIAISDPKRQIYFQLFKGIIADLPAIKVLFHPNFVRDLGNCTLQTAKNELNAL